MFLSQVLWAQAPGIPYQAVLMDRESGQDLPGLDKNYFNPMSNSLVSIRFSIHDVNGMEFEETHHSVKVDDYGMINLIVGKGVYTFNHFYDDMVWNGENKRLKVEVDFKNGNNFENLDYLPLHRMPTQDDQKLSLTGSLLTLEDGGAVKLSELAKDSVFVRELTRDSVFLSNMDDVDDDNQNLTSFTLLGTELEVDIEDGDSVKVDLIGLATDTSFVGTLAKDSVFVTTLAKDSVFVTTLTKDSVFTKHLAKDSVFVRELTRDSVFLSNMNDVDDDNQNLTSFTLLGTELEVDIEDGDSVKVDLIGLATDTSFVGTLAKDSVFVTTLAKDSVFVTTLTKDSVFTKHLAKDSVFVRELTRDTIFLSNMNDVDDDNQNLTSFTLLGTELEVDIEDGDSVKVDLIGLATDTSFVGTLAKDSVFVTTLAKDSVFVTTLTKDSVFSKHLAKDSIFVRELTRDTVFLSNLDSVDDDNQNLSVTVDSLLIEDGTGVKLSDLGTDDQNIANLGINTTSNILTVGIEDGTSQTVDLTHLDNTGTDNQNIANLAINTTSNILTVGIEDGTSQTVDLTHLDNTGTDNQNIANLGINTTSNILTVGIEDGTSQTVDLTHLDNTGTDNQNIANLAINTTSNILTVGIEDGTSQTVDLSHLDNSGSDDQTISIDGDSLRIEDGNAVALSDLSLNTIQTLTSNGSVNSDTDVLLITPGISFMTVTIPAIGTASGQFPEGYELKIKRTTTEGNHINLEPTGSTIDGQAITSLNVSYQSMTIVATSTGWYIVD